MLSLDSMKGDAKIPALFLRIFKKKEQKLERIIYYVVK